MNENNSQSGFQAGPQKGPMPSNASSQEEIQKLREQLKKIEEKIRLAEPTTRQPVPAPGFPTPQPTPAQQHAAPVQAAPVERIQDEIINIRGMHCKSCVDLIELKLNTLKGVKMAKVSLIENKAFVRFNPSETNTGRIKAEIESLGYSIAGAGQNQQKQTGCSGAASAPSAMSAAPISNIKKTLKQGITYGLVPHIGCIAFLAFSILGVTAATSLFRPLLLDPNFFYILIGISFAFATVSAGYYLKKNGLLSVAGAKRKWKYLSTMYGTTIGVNAMMFLFIFPAAANFSLTGNSFANLAANTPVLTLQVQIPCSGHASLISGDLKTIAGVTAVQFRSPNYFDVAYDPTKTNKQQILALDVFKTYPATVTAETTTAQAPKATTTGSTGGGCGGGGGGCGGGAGGGCGGGCGGGGSGGGGCGGGSAPKTGSTQPAQVLAASADNDPTKGSASAPVTIIEFSDFQCPYCAVFRQQTLPQIEQNYINTGKVKFVYRDYPLPFHPYAQKAAEAAECANDQGKYWEYHDKLFDKQSEWSTAGTSKFKEYAASLGLDASKFTACLDSGKYESEVKKDLSDGQSYGVQGTPAFFVNGKAISGARPYSDFQQAIEQALATAQTGTAGSAQAATGEQTVKISLSDVSTTAKFVDYDSNGVKVQFIVVKASDGTVRTAFNACDVCFAAKKGYRQEGNELVCNNCGKRFSIDSLGTENANGGGCWPGYLPSTAKDGFVIIQKTDLESGKWRFA